MFFSPEEDHTFSSKTSEPQNCGDTEIKCFCTTGTISRIEKGETNRCNKKMLRFISASKIPKMFDRKGRINSKAPWVTTAATMRSRLTAFRSCCLFAPICLMWTSTVDRHGMFSCCDKTVWSHRQCGRREFLNSEVFPNGKKITVRPWRSVSVFVYFGRAIPLWVSIIRYSSMTPAALVAPGGARTQRPFDIQ